MIQCQIEYLEALREHQYLLERELRIRREAQDWWAVAERVGHYLGVFVDPRLWSYQAGLRLSKSGISEAKAQELQAAHRAILSQAEVAYAKHQYAECLQLLEPAIQSTVNAWVFTEDLSMLNLWLLAARESEAYQPGELNRRATQLRQSVLQYVHQFSEVIENPQLQVLALNLLDTLQDSMQHAEE